MILIVYLINLLYLLLFQSERPNFHFYNSQELSFIYFVVIYSKVQLGFS